MLNRWFAFDFKRRKSSRCSEAPKKRLHITEFPNQRSYCEGRLINQHLSLYLGLLLGPLFLGKKSGGWSERWIWPHGGRERRGCRFKMAPGQRRTTSVVRLRRVQDEIYNKRCCSSIASLCRNFGFPETCVCFFF